MRPAWRLLVLGAVAVLILGTLSIPSHAACAAPTVRAPKSVDAGATIVIRGQYWAAECNDTIACSVGCLGESCTGGEPSPPATGLRIHLLTASAIDDGGIELTADVDADPTSYGFSEEVTIPSSAEPGRYRLSVGNDAMGPYRTGIIVVEAPEPSF